MTSSFLALDVGDTRIGVALANVEVRFANPLITLTNDETIWSRLIELIGEHDVVQIVIGLPRNLNGDSTDQTRKVEAFVGLLQSKIHLPVQMQDEAATSVKAEAELKGRGKPYEKGAIDALAATYILEDYLSTYQGVDA